MKNTENTGAAYLARCQQITQDEIDNLLGNHKGTTLDTGVREGNAVYRSGGELIWPGGPQQGRPVTLAYDFLTHSRDFDYDWQQLFVPGKEETLFDWFAQPRPSGSDTTLFLVSRPNPKHAMSQAQRQMQSYKEPEFTYAIGGTREEYSPLRSSGSNLFLRVCGKVAQEVGAEFEDLVGAETIRAFMHHQDRETLLRVLKEHDQDLRRLDARILQAPLHFGPAEIF